MPGDFAWLAWRRCGPGSVSGAGRAIILDPPAKFTAGQVETINEYFGLWRARAELRHLPMQRVRPRGSPGTTRELSADALELLEKRGIMAIAPDSTYPFRELNGQSILLAIMQLNEQLEGRRWGIIRPLEDEFCAPDVPMHGVIPISPKLALALDADSGFITRDNLARINSLMRQSAREYVRARAQGVPGRDARSPFNCVDGQPRSEPGSTEFGTPI
ncbi:hypothetical protein ACCC88_02885 [Sphingomonas sp. Sphisp140]|uniref:hypothetical protein n=1 Tax=unclassified Sphingomonas TaxID=196159 RepID=UPI0039B016D6